MDEQQNNQNQWTTIGTTQCGLLCGAIGVALAFLLIFLGFWKSLVIALFFAVGFVLGAFRNKLDAVKKFINSMFPPRGQSTK